MLNGHSSQVSSFISLHKTKNLFPGEMEWGDSELGDSRVTRGGVRVGAENRENK